MTNQYFHVSYVFVAFRSFKVLFGDKNMGKRVDPWKNRDMTKKEGRIAKILELREVAKTHCIARNQCISSIMCPYANDDHSRNHQRSQKHSSEQG